MNGFRMFIQESLALNHATENKHAAGCVLEVAFLSGILSDV